MTLRRLGAILSAIAAGLAIVAAVIGAEIAVGPRHPADGLRPEPAAHWGEGGERIGEGLDGRGPSLDARACAECHDHPAPRTAPRRPAPLPRAALIAILRSL